MLVELSDQDLVNRLTTFEDHFVERKTIGDHKDWVKTVVAFANSAPDGFPCVLFIGVRNNGEIESPQQDLDSVQMKLNEKLKSIYPPAPYLPKIVAKDGRQALAVVVLGSELRPHFSGPAYVRKGSVTQEGSEAQFEELIARRNSKASKILEFKGMVITVFNVTPAERGYNETPWAADLVIEDCNQFWLTLRNKAAPAKFCYPLNKIDLSFDYEKNRLRLDIKRILTT